MEYPFSRKPSQNENANSNEGDNLKGYKSGRRCYSGRQSQNGNEGKFSFQIESSKGLNVQQNKRPSTSISISSSRKLENNKKDPSVSKFVQVFEKKREDFDRKRENLEKKQVKNELKLEKIYLQHMPSVVVEDEWEEITIEEDAAAGLKKSPIYPSFNSPDEVDDNLELSFSSSDEEDEEFLSRKSRFRKTKYREYVLEAEESASSTQISVKKQPSKLKLFESSKVAGDGMPFINITNEPENKAILKTFSVNKRLKSAIEKDKEKDKDEDGNGDGNINGIMEKFYSLSLEGEGRLINLNISQMLDFPYEFAMQPVRLGCLLKCQIMRDKKGTRFPTYFMKMERENGRMFVILTARKRRRSFNSNYLISTDSSELTRYCSSYSGKLRSNMLGTQFTVFDNGENPQRYRFREMPKKVREELAVINYEPNILGFKGPRKVRIVIPSLVNESQRFEFRPVTKRESIFDVLKDEDSLSESGLVELRNKTPKWCEEAQCYVLNFQGRVTKASVKNFQIIHDKHPDYIILQFGKVSKDAFTLDFRFPLCPLQAFAIALSSFDEKLACE